MRKGIRLLDVPRENPYAVLGVRAGDMLRLVGDAAGSTLYSMRHASLQAGGAWVELEREGVDWVLCCDEGRILAFSRPPRPAESPRESPLADLEEDTVLRGGERGVEVLAVRLRSTAERYGFKRGDLIVAAGDRPVRTTAELDTALRQETRVLVLRGEERVTLPAPTTAFERAPELPPPPPPPP